MFDQDEFPQISKTVGGAAVTLKSSPQGALEAAFSVFDVIDSDQDVVQRSAFQDGQPVPMVWAHKWDRPIGRGVVRVEAKQAVFAGKFFLDTTDGRDAYHTVKNMGDLQEYSFGFRVQDHDFGEFEGARVRFIKKVELFEVSPVLVGANRQTRTLALKQAPALALPDPAPAPSALLAGSGPGLPSPAGWSEEWDRLDRELKALWDTAFINNLPDSAFAVILPGGKKDDSGKTVPRSLRKLPHHGSGGGIDLPHLRNALARLPQAQLPGEAAATARRHLERHARSEGVGERAIDPDDFPAIEAAPVAPAVVVEERAAPAPPTPDELAAAVLAKLAIVEARRDCAAALEAITGELARLRAGVPGEALPVEFRSRLPRVEGDVATLVALLRDDAMAADPGARARARREARYADLVRYALEVAGGDSSGSRGPGPTPGPGGQGRPRAR